MKRISEKGCLLLIASFCLNFVSGIDVISLNGIWNLKNTSTGDGIRAKVPGGVHTALMDHGIIGDPFYRKNDENYLWVGRTDWTYYTTFNVSEEFLERQTILLVCDGLDTISVTYINNKEVGRSVNMFVRYIYDVKHALHVGENTIRVEFTSAVNYGTKRQEELGYRVPPECPPPAFHGECNGNKVRKMQCSFSWDWGPAFVSQGIWKDIYLQSFNSVVIRDVTTETSKDRDDRWALKIEVFLDCTTGKGTSGTLTYSLGDVGIQGSKDIVLSGDNKHVSYSMPVTISKDISIDTWWPSGYGNQTLYPLTVTFTTADKSETSTKLIKIGFRTVELVQNLVSKKEFDGRTFYFRINGQPIFLKGSNWIPADIFPERATRDRIYNYLKSAVDAHMNTLRVWGGGLYESNEFYEVADELGILVWQDFAFACALYPTDGPFLQTVSEEITYQIRRLKHHPSLFAYSGNNENEVALNGGWWSGVTGNQRYHEDYLKLYMEVIYKIVKQEDPNRPFMVTSPGNGVHTEQDGGISKSLSAGSTKYGDVHDYGYSRRFYDDDKYKIPRMASEYGLQSLPSYETLASVYDPEDLFYDSPLNKHRQHHPNGNYEMSRQIKMYLDQPNSTDQLQLFKDTIYCTQIDQAIGMRTESELYRRWQTDINRRGEGYTMGALYWMLNDVWQAPTWSSLEYGGKWKMIHYYARKFFAPILISPYKDGDQLKVYIVIDELPVYERKHEQTNKLTFCPTETKGAVSLFKPRKHKTQGLNDCDYGTSCWNHFIWCVLTVCCIFLIVYVQLGRRNQFYHTYWFSRYWKQLWNCTMCCLLILLLCATMHMVSFQEKTRQNLKQKLEQKAQRNISAFAGTLYIDIYTWDSLEAKQTWKIPFKLEKVAQLVYHVQISEILKECRRQDPENCFIVCHLGDLSDGHTSWYPLTTFRTARGLRKANIKISDVSKTSEDEYRISLTTDAVAPFVWLEALGIKGRFCNNGFLMFQQKESVMFYAWQQTDVRTLKESLTIKSLMDIYH